MKKKLIKPYPYPPTAPSRLMSTSTPPAQRLPSTSNRVAPGRWPARPPPSRIWRPSARLFHLQPSTGVVASSSKTINEITLGGNTQGRITKGRESGK